MENCEICRNTTFCESRTILKLKLKKLTKIIWDIKNILQVDKNEARWKVQHGKTMIHKNIGKYLYKQTLHITKWDIICMNI